VAVLEAPGGHRIELLQYLAPVGAPCLLRPCDPGSSHLCLTVDDIEAVCARLRSAGVEVFNAPAPITAGASRGAFAAYLRDPNGILIELFQPPPT
jgi:catechol 2,3-dioxygenase-like lactoylglutathione lyase family enzyme